jgi:hypothetical protein
LNVRALILLDYRTWLDDELAERVGFEPTCRLLARNPISSRARYGHFGTSPQTKKELTGIWNTTRIRLTWQAINRSWRHLMVRASQAATAKHGRDDAAKPSATKRKTLAGRAGQSWKKAAAVYADGG